MRIFLLSDLHGDFDFYYQWIKQIDNSCDVSIQLGDFGLGFNHNNDDNYFNHINEYKNKHFFIAGNHDNPVTCKMSSCCLGDFGVFKNKIFFVRGAKTPEFDKKNRTPMINWWPDEELSVEQCDECLKLYSEIQPEYIISHECPHSIRDMIITPIENNQSRTGILLDEMLKIHQPKLWIFGHYHKSVILNNNTTFRCLNVKTHYFFEI
jgi:predicted phosphodiesterase